MKFFCDNNISPKLTRALGILAEPLNIVVHLQDSFPQDTIDVVWITEIKKKGYIVISGDPKIAKNPHERKALISSGLTVFFLGKGWMNLNNWKFASALFKVFPDIIILSKDNPIKSLFLIERNGKIVRKPTT